MFFGQRKGDGLETSTDEADKEKLARIRAFEAKMQVKDEAKRQARERAEEERKRQSKLRLQRSVERDRDSLLREAEAATREAESEQSSLDATDEFAKFRKDRVARPGRRADANPEAREPRLLRDARTSGPMFFGTTGSERSKARADANADRTELDESAVRKRSRRVPRITGSEGKKRRPATQGGAGKRRQRGESGRKKKSGRTTSRRIPRPKTEGGGR